MFITKLHHKLQIWFQAWNEYVVKNVRLTNYYIYTVGALDVGVRSIGSSEDILSPHF